MALMKRKTVQLDAGRTEWFYKTVAKPNIWYILVRIVFVVYGSCHWKPILKLFLVLNSLLLWKTIVKPLVFIGTAHTYTIGKHWQKHILTIHIETSIIHYSKTLKIHKWAQTCCCFSLTFTPSTFDHLLVNIHSSCVPLMLIMNAMITYIVSCAGIHPL